MALSYRKQRLSGWGRYAASSAAVGRPERRYEVAQALGPGGSAAGSVIARGSGLAYGDAAANAGGRVLAMNRLNRFLAFDADRGLLTCEAGVTIGEVLDVCIPRGWFPVVTPGTARATVGGCFACDVHGRNHHAVGSFSQHVSSATIVLANGQAVVCAPERSSELFWASAGGMGLTGVVLDLTLRLQRIETAWMEVRNLVARNLDQTFRLLDETADAAYSVAWLDGVRRGPGAGRGIVMLGEHAKLAELPAEQRANALDATRPPARSLPFGVPFGLLRVPIVALLNAAIYRRHAAAGGRPARVGAHSYFYPLDTFDNWNTLLGRKGFFEYQALLPPGPALDSVRQMLALLARSGAASFFTSIKRLGANAPGPLSFPAPGYAFSFDVSAADKSILPLLDRCDDITLAAGGRVYLAKDARLSAAALARMYPRLAEWKAILRRYDPAGVFASSLSRRLELAA